MNARLVATMGVVVLPIAAGAGVAVNFHDSFPDSFGNGPTVFSGQGAYFEPGHDVWNSLPDNGATSAPALASDGSATGITVTATFGFTNGGAFPNNQGQPRFLLGNCFVVNGVAALGTFSIQNVPAGTYDLYLYGTNYDHNRGTSFTVSSGAADGGVSSTLNNTLASYIEGVNYVLFHGVTPDAGGNISGTWLPNPADGVGNPNLPGEGNFNGFQLVASPAALGGCCLAASLTCVPAGATACANGGGTFQGAGSTCNPSPCPFGACCTGCNGCVIAAASSCSGTYGGNGSACTAAAGCTIVNASFEAGDFSGWTQFGDTSFTTVYSGTGDDGVTTPHGGSFAGEFGPGPATGGVQQTIPAHIGDQVAIGFWYNAVGGTPNSFSATFDGQTLVSITDDVTNVTWTQFAFNVTSTSSNPQLAFAFYNAPLYSNLDDVTVCITPSATGACCAGSTCAAGTAAACIGANRSYSGNGTTCNAFGVNNRTPCCLADYNHVGGVTVQDIFDFLAAYFTQNPLADINASNTVTVQDIFDFLSAYFAGCA